ncbi:MAG: ThiF family adenylyltransferase [Candidatus Sericytochromatia bacterium]|nr:ThiF family adenylyltransferase [Candidatus Sericytochromatia bacterium]
MNRYQRLEALPWWDREAVRGAVFLVAGVGAVGNEVLKNLALLGIGRIILVDRDQVTLHNLTRSVLFRSSDVGRPKVVAAAERLCELEPDLRLLPLHLDVASLSPSLVASADVVLGCLDSLAAQVMLGRACRAAGRPWIQGGLGGAADVFKVTLAVHPAGEGPCLECHLPVGIGDEVLAATLPRGGCAREQQQAEEEGGIPSTPMAASILGGLMVQEALAVLHSLRHLPPLGTPPAWGGYMHWNTRAHEAHLLRRPGARSGCPWHQPTRIIRLETPVADRPLAELCDLLGSDGGLVPEGALVQHPGCPACGRTNLAWRWTPTLPAPCPACGQPDPLGQTLRFVTADHPVATMTPRQLEMWPGTGLSWVTPTERQLLTWPVLT